MSTLLQRVKVWLRGVTAPEPRIVSNDYGFPVTQMRCDHCGELFTVTGDILGRVSLKEWGGRVCLASTCDSYDPTRDVDNMFGVERA